MDIQISDPFDLQLKPTVIDYNRVFINRVLTAIKSIGTKQESILFHELSCYFLSGKRSGCRYGIEKINALLKKIYKKMGVDTGDSVNCVEFVKKIQEFL